MTPVEQLHQKWERAMERGRSADLIEALVELERLEPREPLWSHRLGDALRRAGRAHDAAEAFVRAMDRYRASGFLPRAIAMAKLVETLEPQRVGLVSRLVPSATERPPHIPPEDDRNSIEITLDDADFEIIAEDGEVSGARPLPTRDPMKTFDANLLFGGLARQALIALANASELTTFTRGETVMTRDELADSLFVVVDGTVRVDLEPSVTLSDGDVFGEVCLLDEGRRLADVRAETDLIALRIEKRALDAIVIEHPELRAKLFELLARRMVANLVATSPLFTVFEQAERLELAQMFEVRAAARGLVLAGRGKRIDGLYIVLTGEVFSEASDGTVVRVPRGSTFGQGSLLGNSPSQLTVTAESEAVVLRLPAARFSTLAMCYPPALAHLSDASDEPLLRAHG